MAATVFSAPSRRALDTESITLDAGGHESPTDGMCIMEAVALLAGEPWSDRPLCVSPVIMAFLRNWNDMLKSSDRQQLKQHIPSVIGTRTTRADDVRRAWVICDWLVRTQAPAWLRLSGMAAGGEVLVKQPEVNPATAPLIRPTIDVVRCSIEQRLGAMRAGQVDYAVANEVAWDTGYDAAYDALGFIAIEGVGFICNDDWDAALGLTLAAIRLASDQELDATVTELQTSAHRMVQRMCEVGR